MRVADSKQDETTGKLDTGSATPNKTPFITGDSAEAAYTESKNWMRPYFEPLDEFERIARNRPSSKIDPQLPRVTDGTLAAIIQETPKRTIQQLPSGEVKSPEFPEYAEVADIVLVERLVPYYNRMGDALQKSWNMLGKAMTYGMSTSYTFFTQTDGKLHTDYVIPYAKDVLVEKGKVFAADSNIRFMRAWYQKRDLQAIINREQQFAKQIKGYKTDWQLKKLWEFMEAGASAKPADLQTPAEKEKGGNDTGGYEVIYCFQKGIGAEFYAFSPKFDNGKPFRVKVNKDPRGAIPLDDLYCNIDLSNPMGRGVVELSGGVQNLIDQQMQMFQFLSTLMMGPPIITSGSVNKASLKYRPNSIWDKGASANNTIEPLKIDNSFIANYVGNMQYLQSKINNLNASQDTSVPASNNNSGQSKTSAGVKEQQLRLGSSDNYLRKQFESWDEKQKETSLNVYFAEMTGDEQIDLSDQQVRELSTTRAVKLIENGKLNVKYGDINDVVFRFKVDPDSSKSADDQDQLQKLQELVTEIESNPLVVNYYMGQAGKNIKIGEIYTQRFKRMGLDNLDSILTDMSPEEADAAKKSPFPIVDKPQFRINSADLTAEQLAAVIAEGGVNLPPPQQPPQPGGPPPGLSPQGVADYMVEMTKAQATAQAGANQQPAAPTGPSPEELALKHRELDIKQQTVDQGAVKTALEVHKTAHQHTMDTHNALQPTITQGTPESVDGKGTKTPAVDPTVDMPVTAPTDAPQQPQDGLHAPQGQEANVVHALLQAGFTEQDVEQAIVMLRRGMPVEQIMQALQAKRGQ